MLTATTKLTYPKMAQMVGSVSPCKLQSPKSFFKTFPIVSVS